MTRPSITARGEWPPGLAYFRLGAGPQAVFIPGLSSGAHLPTGPGLWVQVRLLAAFAQHRELIWLNRRKDLAPPTTITRMTEDWAQVIRAQLTPPVDVIGLSTGGSIALQLALDHPELVRKLVVVSAAHRLSDDGRRVQRELAAALRAGRPGRAGAVSVGAMAAGPLGRAVLTAGGWLTGRATFGDAGADLLAVLDAEDDFDIGPRLPEIVAPTLVVGAERDRYYSPQLFRETAEGVPRGRLVLYPRRGHMGAALQRRFPGDVRAFLDGR